MDQETENRAAYERAERRPSLAIPIAIVIAGIFIAGAVYLRAPATTAVSDNQYKVQKGDVAIKPVGPADHILGNPNADLVIVEYSDTECPFCKNFQATMEKVSTEYGKDGKVAWVYRHFPIVQLHSKAPHEAEATECAAELGGETKFWDYINKVFEVTPSNDGLDPAQLTVIATSLGLNTAAFQNCLDSGKYTAQIEADVDEAKKAGAEGTPYSVFVMQKALSSQVIKNLDELSLNLQFPPGTLTVSPDKKRLAVSGALPYDILTPIIDLVLKN